MTRDRRPKTKDRMSKTNSTAKPKKTAKPAASAKTEVGPLMFGRDIFVEALERAALPA